MIHNLTGTSRQDRVRGSRPLSTIDALVLHQMAFDRGNNPARYLGVNAHFIILRDGTTAQLHQPENLLHASNALNARSVAVEFAGNMQTSPGRWWSPDDHGRHTITLEQITSGRDLIKELKNTLHISYVFAHRQGTNRHTGCCGPDVWFHVGQWAISSIDGITDGGTGFTMGDGLCIPAEWRRPSPTT